MITKHDSIQDLRDQGKLVNNVLDRFMTRGGSYEGTLQEFGDKHAINSDLLTIILNGFQSLDWLDKTKLSGFRIPEILHYLKNTHVYYLEKRLPEIELTLHNFIRRYHHTHPMMVSLGNLFLRYKAHLSTHIRFEDEQLFPHIEFIYQALSKADFPTCRQRLNQFSLAHFEDHHSNVEEELQQAREILSYHASQQPKELSLRIFSLQLEYLEKDLHIHSLIEDEILLPKALMLESTLYAQMDGQSLA